LKKGRKGYIV